MKNKILFLSTTLLAFYINMIKANNVSITNISCPSTTTIQFDIAWENSWNVAGVSYDAVWVFVKAQVCGGFPSQYVHANVSTASVDHSAGGGVLQVDAVTDGKGVFIRRSAVGIGNIAAATVVLKFSGTYVIANTNFEVLGIEMVYVAQGAFTVGDGSPSSTSSYASFGTAGASTPLTISSEGALAQDALYSSVSAPGSIGQHAAIIAAFPKGYNAFYCMKYEISQQQYVAFLNLLDFVSQATRTAISPASTAGTLALTTVGNQNRNSIEISTPGSTSAAAVYGNDLNGKGTNTNGIYDENGDGGDVACNYLSWDDLKAYLDWAALRPMTELEYEKACRGTTTPLLREYAWGSVNVTAAVTSSITLPGEAGEVSSVVGDGLICAGGAASTTLGPFRAGFAATAITWRTGAGASFYGIMELSGNVWEQTFQCGYFISGARTSVPIFTGILGDGALDGGGSADAVNWGGGVALSIVRGGNWEYGGVRAQVSDRYYLGTFTENTARLRRTGGRGVRQY